MEPPEAGAPADDEEGETMGIWQDMTQGLAGNMRPISEDEARHLYGPWLLDGERLQEAFRLLRDGFALTDRRLILMDRQGVTGQKTRVFSIPLASVIAVTAETAGSGFDDSELTLTYISSPHRRGVSVTYDSYRFEFPKSFDIHTLYRYFAHLAEHNVIELNR